MNLDHKKNLPEGFMMFNLSKAKNPMPEKGRENLLLNMPITKNLGVVLK